MKFFNKLFLGAGLLAAPVVQAQQQVTLPAFYQNYYKIADRERGKVWDHNLRDYNVLGWDSHGGTNQQWMIMPTFPGSSEYIIVSRATGDVLNVYGSHGYVRNIDVYRYGFTGKNSQIFTMNPVYDIPGYYTFHSPSMPGTEVERCNSSQAHSAWESPDHKGNNIIIRGGYHWSNGNANTHFRLDAVASAPYGPTSYLYQSNNVTLQPPNPTDMLGSNLCVECSEHLMGETYIPFPMVTNDLPRHIQVNSTPYYKLQRYQLYKYIKSARFLVGGSQTQEMSVTTGTTHTDVEQVEKTLNINFSISGEVTSGIKFGIFELGSKTSSSLQQSFGLKVTSTVTNSEVYSETKHYVISYAPKTNTLIADYQLVDRYVLTRADGTVLKKWDVNYAPSFNTQSYFYETSSGGRMESVAPVVVKKGYNSAGVYTLQLADRPAKLSSEKADFGFAVASVYPNPFQSAVQISLSAPESAKVSVQLYNMQGQQVKQMAKTISENGVLELDAAGLSDGIYMMKVHMVSEADPKRTFSYQKKLVLKK